MEFGKRYAAEEYQDQRYLNTVIMKYNTILLKMSKYKQLDLARIKQLDTLSQLLISEMPACNENEIRNIVDNLHLFGWEKSFLKNIKETDYDPTICLRNLLHHLSKSPSSSSTDCNNSNESSDPMVMIPNYDQFSDLDREVESCTETFQELEKRIGTILHAIQISPPQTYETNISQIMESVSKELEAAGLNNSAFNTDFSGGETTVVTVIQEDPPDRLSENLLQLYRILWPSSESNVSSEGGDIVAELLQRLRQRHHSALTKTAALCESYCPFHIHLKNRDKSFS